MFIGQINGSIGGARVKSCPTGDPIENCSHVYLTCQITKPESIQYVY